MPGDAEEGIEIEMLPLVLSLGLFVGLPGAFNRLKYEVSCTVGREKQV